MSRATGLAPSGRDAQNGVKTRRHEFGEFIKVKQQEGGPLAALSPLEEKGVTGEVEKKPHPASIRAPGSGWQPPRRGQVRIDGGCPPGR